MSDKLVMLTVKVPRSYIVAMDRLVTIGLYSSRSEFVRAAIRELLRKHLYDQAKGLEQLIHEPSPRINIEEIDVDVNLGEDEDIDVEIVEKNT